jgi:hypothetical protein
MTRFMVRRIPVTGMAVISSAPAGPAAKRPGTGRLENVVVAAVGLATVVRMARDRRTYERIILAAIVLAAAADAARTGQARSIARLAAWDRHRTLAEQRRAKAARSEKSLATR